MLKKYIEEHSEFICEVPKVEASSIKSMKRCCRLNPFRSVHTYRNRKVDFSRYVDDVSYSLTTAEKLIHDAFNIQRKPTGQLLAYVLTDADREFNKHHPSHSIIAYALVCGSIRMEKNCKMLNNVLDICKDRNVQILSKCYDSQFRKLVCRSEDDKPLTWFMWQKDLWTNTIKMTKREMFKKLNEVSLVDAEILEELGSKQPAEEFSYSFKNLTFDNSLEDGNCKLFIHSNGGPRDNYESLLMHHIYTTRKWKHRHYDTVWDYRQKSQNVSTHEKPEYLKKVLLNL